MPYCRACPASIVFAQQNPTEKNRYPANNPLDTKPSANGNLRLDRVSMRYDVLTGAELQAARESGEELFTSHFATCPARKQFRKAAPGKRSGEGSGTE